MKRRAQELEFWAAAYCGALRQRPAGSANRPLQDRAGARHAQALTLDFPDNSALAFRTFKGEAATADEFLIDL